MANLDKRADKRSIEQWLGTSNQLFEAIDILTDIYNGDYTVKAFRNDVDEYFEPDDKDDSWITFTDKDK